MPARNGREPSSLNVAPKTTRVRLDKRAYRLVVAGINRIARDSPARLALMVFAGIILFLTGLLCLPAATARGESATFLDALFTATSAVCVTGLTVVNTATFWSPFGQLLISFGVIVGGLGVMTLASILGMAVSRHVGLTQRMLTASENQSSLGDVSQLLRTVVIVSLSAQGVLFLMLLPFFASSGRPLVEALWYAYFMAVSIFNNGGFVIMPEGMSPYVGDLSLSIPIILGTFAGAVGFPVILDMWRRRQRPSRWSITTKITLVTYLALFVVGVVSVSLSEWNNPGTFGPLSTWEKLDAALVVSADARSTGLTPIDIGQMHEAGMFMLDSLMFIGGGSASTAGGIKVTTLAVLLLAVRTEARGDLDTEAFGRRIPPEVLRLAISAALAGTLMVGSGVIALLVLTNFNMTQILLEVTSAFATCGLSTGITEELPAGGQLVLIALMFFGRTGTMTIAAALSLRQRPSAIRLPEERPIIG